MIKHQNCQSPFSDPENSTCIYNQDISSAHIYNVILDLNTRLDQIENTQVAILNEVTALKHDFKLILANSGVESQGMKEQIPNHPVTNSEELEILEQWTNDPENHKLLVIFKIQNDNFMYFIHLVIDI